MVLYDFQFFYLHSRRKLDRKDSRKFEVAAVHLKAQEAHLTQLNNNIMYCQRNRSSKKNKYCPRPEAERTAGTAKEPEAVELEVLFKKMKLNQKPRFGAVSTCFVRSAIAA